MRLDVLFISELPLWPLDQGFRVHGCHMAWALAELGAKVRMASLAPTSPDAPDPLRRLLINWPEASQEQVKQFLRGWSGPLAGARQRLAQHQGVESALMAGLLPLLDYYQPRTVVGLGPHAPLMLRGLPSWQSGGPRRIWYAADEPVYFQFSCLRREPLAKWPSRLRHAALYAGIQRLFAPGLDGVIGVSPRDTAWLKLWTGAREAVTIRNGVDLQRFAPESHGAGPQPKSLAFWGRLDFEPNIDAVCWFARYVWPQLRAKHPGAVWRIAGKNATGAVRALASQPGIELHEEVPDIRPFARAAEAVVLPMRCGAGIKNKLLEAAAMGLPIVASPQAVCGLEFDRQRPPVLVCQDPRQWTDAIGHLWSDLAYRRSVADAGLAWVRLHHRWTDAAATLRDWLDAIPTTTRADEEEVIEAELDEEPVRKVA